MSMMKITLPSSLLEGTNLHFPRTTVITLYGPGAVGKANNSWLASVLHGPGGIPIGAIDELYRFQNPTRWFFSASDKMSQDVYEGLHGKRIKVPGTDICLELEHVEKERTRITVHWLPVTLLLEGVKTVVEAITGDSDAEVLRLHNQGGKWGVLCRPTRVIPHYALIEIPGRRNEWHRIKITVQGRQTDVGAKELTHSGKVEDAETSITHMEEEAGGAPAIEIGESTGNKSGSDSPQE